MNQSYMPHSSLIFRIWFENEANRWKGVWVDEGGDKPIYVRKTFGLPSKPTRTIAFASVLGHFNFLVNGRPASDHVFDLGWTNYHRAVQFVAYDLTEQLIGGNNAIGAHVGNGFYAGDQGDRFFWLNYKDQTYVQHGNELCFFCELHLFYEDGKHDVIISGLDWRVRKSDTKFANIYASKRTTDELTLMGGILRPSKMPSGLLHMPDPLFKEFETHVYSKIILSGTGEAEIWQPDFSFTSARYIQAEDVALEGGKGLPVIHYAVGQHVSSGAKRLGSMKTDKGDVNQLINACY